MNNPNLFEYTEVDSSNIKAIGYNPVHDILSVTFNSEEEYWYFNVPALAFADFFEAESKGKHFHAEIKDKYVTLKVAYFQQEPLIDAIEILRTQMCQTRGLLSFSETCELFGLDFSDTWLKVMGRTEWYRLQPDEYKDAVRVKIDEIKAKFIGQPDAI